MRAEKLRLDCAGSCIAARKSLYLSSPDKTSSRRATSACSTKRATARSFTGRTDISRPCLSVFLGRRPFDPAGADSVNVVTLVSSFATFNILDVGRPWYTGPELRLDHPAAGHRCRTRVGAREITHKMRGIPVEDRIRASNPLFSVHPVDPLAGPVLDQQPLPDSTRALFGPGVTQIPFHFGGHHGSKPGLVYCPLPVAKLLFIHSRELYAIPAVGGK